MCVLKHAAQPAGHFRHIPVAVASAVCIDIRRPVTLQLSCPLLPMLPHLPVLQVHSEDKRVSMKMLITAHVLQHASEALNATPHLAVGPQ
jgi:hypothetical protein